MTLLAINTAQAACDLALLREDGQTIALANEDMARGQDARLPALVTDLLTAKGLGFSDLTRLAVCVGPGSFTGVRIGVAYGRGLALALGIPCIGVTALEACIAPDLAGPVRIALQAQKRPPDITFWTQLLTGPEQRHEPEEWSLDLLKDAQTPILTDRPDLLLAREGTSRPSALHIAQWAARADPEHWPPRPAYVRPPDAALPGGKTP
ncbi:MAG: tRNA (adenosine(37)-N6)-threonylcarbamoyltransferase complex dimerization subunit type 1 TsaB [Hyphomonadaceae bacterium]|nr:tRNA (adenosine(37)-N6)-threonylcarbamoyltransferase complex dimerization subunit type 1 TsaB [Hyphomonadaceae bacterium]